MAGDASARISTGIAGLDTVLNGGLIPGRAYLVRGGPGTGKTILGLHYLVAGAAKGEFVLCMTFGEPEMEIRKNAELLGLDLRGISFLDLSPSSETFSKMQTYNIFSPAEVERQPFTQRILDKVGALKPKRIFLDAMTQFRYLAADPYQFRKQVVALLRYLTEGGATVLFASEGTEVLPDDDLQFMSDGIIHLDQAVESGRRVSITKYRGSDFLRGYHAVRVSTRGMEVFPQLIEDTTLSPASIDTVPTGVTELDNMLHGGLERGTVTLISGPSGTGKTTLGMQVIKEAARRGERSLLCAFEEETEILFTRCDAVNIPARALHQKGTLNILHIKPRTTSLDEFAAQVRTQVEAMRARVVMIDSTGGYQLALFGDQPTTQLYTLCKYLQNRGVVTLLIAEVDAVGCFPLTSMHVSYLADTTLFLRFIEYHLPDRLELRRAVGVLKKRTTDFEKDLRLLEMTPAGLVVGQQLPRLSSIVADFPVWDRAQEERR